MRILWSAMATALSSLYMFSPAEIFLPSSPFNASIVFLVINYNLRPVRKNKGSAIFLHCSFDDLRPTAGCVAVSKESFKHILKELRPNTFLDICDN